MTEAAIIGRREQLTFRGNLKQSRYGWLRLTPAYSVHLVTELLGRDHQTPGQLLDPFGGTGTTALVCAEKGLSSCTADINPFLTWLTAVKTASYSQGEITELCTVASDVGGKIKDTKEPCEWTPALHQIDKWWDPATLHALARGMATIKDAPAPSGVSDLLQLAFCRTLIDRANVSFGHQSMSFKKRKAREATLTDAELSCLVAEAWRSAVEMVARSAQSVITQQPQVALCDARHLADGLGDRYFGRVITSPPYPNRMSYIRELRPYMYWLGYLSDGRAAGELDWQAIGGTWGCATSNVGKWIPDSPREIPYAGFQQILNGIAERSDVLSRYVHKYFFDMVDHVSSLKGMVEPGGVLHYIVGNSKFYDVLLPVEKIYAAMFIDVGFDDVRIETVRKRSSKRELFEYVVSARQPT